MYWAWLITFLLINGGTYTVGNIVLMSATNSTFQASSVHMGVRYRLSTEMLSNKQASQTCWSENATLLEIRNADVAGFIYSMLESTPLKWNAQYINDGVWMGLKLNKTNILAYWQNNDELKAAQYSNWAPREPGTAGAFCVQLWRAHRWQWDDTYCDISLYFICQDQDPQTYSQSQVSQLTSSILQLSLRNTTTRYDVNKLVSQVNTLLDISAEMSSISQPSLQDVIHAVDRSINNYNATTLSDYKVNRLNLEIDIKNFLAENGGIFHSALFGETGRASDNRSSSTILSNALVREALALANGSSLQINSVVYRKPTLFVEQDWIDDSLFGEGPISHVGGEVISHVISTEVKNVVMRNLKTPLVITHVVPLLSLNLSFEISNTTMFAEKMRPGKDCLFVAEDHVGETRMSKTVLKCAYWEFGRSSYTGSWSGEGCHMTNVTSNGVELTVTCTCDHMTHFAVILDTNVYYEPQYLTYLTMIGCSVSIACLFCTLFTYLYFKQLRSKLPHQILIHLCIAMMLLNIFFLIGIERVHFETFCYVTTVLLHYAVLLVWSWMVAEAVFLYRAFVLSDMSTGGGRFIWIASLFCYVIPAIVVSTISLSLAMEDYRSERYCWLSSSPLLFSIVIPVGIVMIVNFLIFTVIMYNITFRSRAFRKHLDLKRISQAVRRALCMIFVLGLPWVFGFFMLLSKDDALKSAFAHLFTFFNAFQGLFIFILYCVRQDVVRNMWTKPLGTQYRRTVKLFRERNLAKKIHGGESAADSEKASKNGHRNTFDTDASMQTHLSSPTFPEEQPKMPAPPPPPKKLLPPPAQNKPHLPIRFGIALPH